MNKPLIIAAQEYAEKINKHIPGYTVERALKIFEGHFDYVYKWLKLYSNYRAYLENTKKLVAMKTISIDYLVLNNLKLNKYFDEFNNWGAKFIGSNAYSDSEMIKESRRLVQLYKKAYDELYNETMAIYKKYSALPGSEASMKLILENFEYIGENYKILADTHLAFLDDWEKQTKGVK